MQLDNPKHELFVQALIKHKGNRTKAYREIYPDANAESARRLGSALLTNIDIKRRLSEFLDAQGLGVIELNTKLKELSEAEKAIVVDKVIQFVPDNTARVDCLKTAYKLHGLLGSDIESHIDNRQVNIHVEPAEMERLAKIVKDIEEMNRKLQLDETQSGEIR